MTGVQKLLGNTVSQEGFADTGGTVKYEIIVCIVKMPDKIKTDIPKLRDIFLWS